MVRADNQLFLHLFDWENQYVTGYPINWVTNSGDKLISTYYISW